MTWDEVWQEFEYNVSDSQYLLKLKESFLYINDSYRSVWTKYYMEDAGYLDILKSDNAEEAKILIEESFRADFRQKLEAILDQRDFNIWPEKALLGFDEPDNKEKYEKSTAIAKEYLLYNLQISSKFSELIEYWRSENRTLHLINSKGDSHKILTNINSKNW